MNTTDSTKSSKVVRPMSVGFAGSRCLDERRRRRLAQTAEVAERRAPVRVPAPAPSTPESQFAASPFESLVRPQLWINLVWTFLATLVCGGTVAAGAWIDTHRPDAAASFGLRGLWMRALMTGLLVIGAQLAYAILWYRARSRKDFHGRYRIWNFAFPALLLFAFCAATDGHHVAAAFVSDRWHLTGPHMPTLLWLVPAGVVLLALARLLHTEMRGTAGTGPCLWLTVLGGGTSAAALLDAPLPLAAQTSQVVHSAATLLWPLSLTIALLLYARRVMYVTNEPVALPPVANGTAERDWFAWWRPRRKRPPREAAPDSARKPVVVSDAASQTVKPVARSAESAAPASSQSSTGSHERAPASVREPSGTSSKDAAAPKPAERQPAARTEPDQSPRPQPSPPPAGSAGVRYPDEDDETDSPGADDPRIRGLSRKERKRLRKLEQQRERLEARRY